MFVAIGPMVWGKGETALAAAKEARRHLPSVQSLIRFPVELTVYEGPENMGVTEYGEIVWEDGTKQIHEVATYTIKKKGGRLQAK